MLPLLLLQIAYCGGTNAEYAETTNNPIINRYHTPTVIQRNQVYLAVRNCTHHLARIVPIKQDSLDVRPSNSNLYSVPVLRKTSACAWNSLPVNVMSTGNIIKFRHQIKTHLFNLTYRVISRYLPHC